ncbi:MAG: hypothetical protein Q9221_004382 [Calogaya cf. arnoldii]
MNEVSRCACITPAFPQPTTPSSPTRPASPAKRTSVGGDSSSFLTALAAQERRVLELREELQKAEIDLSRLKKQWATHEAIKKRNEFRHREKLQKLEPASRSSYEECLTRDGGSAIFDSYKRLPSETERDEQEAQTDGEQRANQLNSTRQTQRRVFAGSRHTRALSLLSKAGTTKNASSLVREKPSPQTPHPSQTSTTCLKRSQTLSTRRTPHRTSAQEPSNGQHKEVFIETGKQFVGDLREGLWTFFEDLRQATVGEEASSDPNRTVKVTPNAVVHPSSQRASQEGYHYALASLSEHGPGSRNTSSENHIISTPVQQRSTVPRDKKHAQINNSPCGSTKQAVSSDDEDPWDTWETPVAAHPACHSHAESITSDSVASASTRIESPRSSLR